MSNSQQKTYSVKDIRKTHVQAYAKWSKEENEWLRKAYDDFREKGLGEHRAYNKMIAAFAQKLGRKPGAISSRIKKLFYPAFSIQDIASFEKRAVSNIKPVQKHKLAPPQPKLEFSPEAKEALRIMEETGGESLFLTGRAGTGKSTLLNYFRARTKKNVAVLAPTGVAAVNVSGQTIHSFCKFTPETSIQKIKKLPPWDDRLEILKHLDAIVIDEISMARADLMDMLDKFLRLNGKHPYAPFGGLQMIFIGDLYQLPPVVVSAEKQAFEKLYPSPYFFDAKIFGQHKFHFLELETVYRQRDENFVALLNAIRNNSAKVEHFEALNRRFNPKHKFTDGDFTVCLTSTNQLAFTINEEKLNRLPGKAENYQGRMSGKFDPKQIPTEMELKVKVGAQVMLLNNDRAGRWVNGTMGKIVDIVAAEDLEEDVDEACLDEDGGPADFYRPSAGSGKADAIAVELGNGETYRVFPHTWEMFEYRLSENKTLDTETVGRFTQYPLKLAWAITIHKAQGKTFDKVAIDLGRGTFVHGQLYVALSRCRSLEGITLKQPLEKRHVLMDWRIVKFVTRYQYGIAAGKMSLDDKIAMIKKAINEGSALKLVYLKANDEKSRRVVEPLTVGEMEYQDVKYLGMEAFCRERKDKRVFRLDRILEIVACA